MTESTLHRSMKDAAITHLAKDCRYWKEYTHGIRGDALRVDVMINKNGRRYLVECETRPNIERLMDKGRRRNKIRGRNLYVLVVGEEWFDRLDGGRLRGFFDIVQAYNSETHRFTDRRDLRTLGTLRDSVLDIMVPLIKAERTQAVIWWIRTTKNQLKWRIIDYLQCTSCKLGIPNPWIFCPSSDCEDSQSQYDLL